MRDMHNIVQGATAEGLKSRGLLTFRQTLVVIDQVGMNHPGLSFLLNH